MFMRNSRSPYETIYSDVCLQKQQETRARHQEELKRHIEQGREALGLTNREQGVNIQTMLQDACERYEQRLEQREAELTKNAAEELARQETELNGTKIKEVTKRERPTGGIANVRNSQKNGTESCSPRWNEGYNWK